LAPRGLPRGPERPRGPGPVACGLARGGFRGGPPRGAPPPRLQERSLDDLPPGPAPEGLGQLEARRGVVDGPRGKERHVATAVLPALGVFDAEREVRSEPQPLDRKSVV